MNDEEIIKNQIRKTCGAIITQQRVENGISLRQLAKHCGLTDVRLGEIERGVMNPCTDKESSNIWAALDDLCACPKMDTSIQYEDFFWRDY